MYERFMPIIFHVANKRVPYVVDSNSRYGAYSPISVDLNGNCHVIVMGFYVMS